MDSLYGNDGDWLVGRANGDVLTGGRGANPFVFVHAKGTTTDKITDFNGAEGGRIAITTDVGPDDLAQWITII